MPATPISGFTTISPPPAPRPGAPTSLCSSRSRCVPCADCKGFDAEVAKNNQRIKNLAQEAFVAVRQVEMKGVDLSQFQFDYDLNWAAMFINADGTVYARYGTQSAMGADAYNSVESLEKTMRRVLALHNGYPANQAALAGKLGKPKPYKSALQMPGMKHRSKLAGSTARNNCVHCHNIHDAEHEQLQDAGRLNHDALWRYPLPDNLGLQLDPSDGLVVTAVQADSPADKAGPPTQATCSPAPTAKCSPPSPTCNGCCTTSRTPQPT